MRNRKGLALVRFCLSWALALLVFSSASATLASARGPHHGSTPTPGPVGGTIEDLGKALFFDTNLSHPHVMSCATCHDPDAGFGDPDSDVPVSQGAVWWRFGNRNSPTVAYTMYSPTLHFDSTPRPGAPNGMYIGGFFWDGRADSLEEQAGGPFLNALEMNNPDKDAVVMMVGMSSYAGLFREIFGDNSLNDVETAYGYIEQAIAAYERSDEVNQFNSKFDAHLAGIGSLTAQELRGYDLFSDKGKCANCHTLDGGPGGQPIFTNFGYHNMGVPKNPENPFYEMPAMFNPDGPNYVDLGLGGFLQEPAQNGKFKTPTLRNVALTAPYMHNGCFQTLREVVEFKNTRDIGDWPAPEVPENVYRAAPPMPNTIGQLGLTNQEIDDIVAFMGALTDNYTGAPVSTATNTPTNTPTSAAVPTLTPTNTPTAVPTNTPAVTATNTPKKHRRRRGW